MWVGLVAMKVWMRRWAAGSMASQQRSMSLWAVRESPQMVGPSMDEAMAWTASKSPWLAMGNPASNVVDAQAGQLIGDLQFFPGV
tara:strand:- start:46 stop:300 length:255 start_codon:yes stop_codon:yes gene_type:complete